MTEGYSFLVDVGLVRALAEGDTSPFVEGDWFQLAKSGTFFSPTYGKVTISERDLQTMERNFREITPKAPTQLPIDYDHKSDNPELHAAGESRAAGWVQDLELREDNTELWCLPRWTKRAASMIAAGEYRFVSPFFLTNYMDKMSGKKVGATLKAVAITNRPFLEGMQEIPAPAIAASDTAVKEFAKDGRVAVPTKEGVQMAEEKKEGEDGPSLTCPHCGAPVSHDGSHKAAQEKQSKTLETVKAALLEGEDGDEEVEEPPIKKEEKKMPEEKKEEVKMSESEAALKEEVRQLKEALEETQKSLKTIQQRNSSQESERLVQLGLSEGKLTPKLIGTKEKPGWAMAFAEKDPDGFRTWLEDAPEVVEFGERGTSDEKAADGAASTAQKIDELAMAEVTKNPKLPYNDAVKKVIAGNRALAESYDEAMIGERRSFGTSAQAVTSNVRRVGA